MRLPVSDTTHGCYVTKVGRVQCTVFGRWNFQTGGSDRVTTAASCLV